MPQLRLRLPFQHTLPRVIGAGFFAALTFAAGAQEAPSPAEAGLKASSVEAQVADLGTTAIGLAMGAAEANPLGLGLLAVKAIGHQKAQEAPALERPRLWRAQAATGYGAAANNTCVILSMATGMPLGAAVCPAIGLLAGLGHWASNEERENRAVFDEMCKLEQAKNPALTCVYREPAPASSVAEADLSP